MKFAWWTFTLLSCFCWLAYSKYVPAESPFRNEATSVDHEEIFHARTRPSIVLHSGHIEERKIRLKDSTTLGRFNNSDSTKRNAVFYAIHLHDFDMNTQLDGLEILTLLSLTSLDLDPVALIVAIDELLLFDRNNDGFLNYGEWLEGIHLYSSLHDLQVIP